MEWKLHPSSFRDPSGFMFTKDGVLYRQVNQVFKDDFDLFTGSGCYDQLAAKNLLIPHQQIEENLTGSQEWYTTLRPEPVHFISYPYEWSFDMLKDAALLTLQLLRESVAFGLILKDASPYNIQWHQGRLIFIDSLSFERYRPEETWIAYRQFCENFLSPLLLMHYSKSSLQPLMLAYPEGIPLAVTRSLLPKRSRFSLYVYLHVHLHAKMAQKKPTGQSKGMHFSKQKLLNLVTSLETLMRKLKAPAQKTTWSEYYEEAARRDNYLSPKKEIIQQWLNGLTGIRTAADLGANDGEFSRLLSSAHLQTIAADADATCINHLYLCIRKESLSNIQPLVLDLSQPSPAIGLNNEERSSLITRLNADLVLALALLHHLAIGKNIPFESLADLFHRVSRKWLIIEFIPKQDEKIQLMLSDKKDIYAAYSKENFEKAFEKYFNVIEQQPVGTSGRILYLMSKA